MLLPLPNPESQPVMRTAFPATETAAGAGDSNEKGHIVRSSSNSLDNMAHNHSHIFSLLPSPVIVVVQ